jgi:hypothetical protein
MRLLSLRIDGVLGVQKATRVLEEIDDMENARDVNELLIFA